VTRMSAAVTGIYRSMAATAALLTLLSMGLCLCPEVSGEGSSCHEEAAAVRMAAACCCGEGSVLAAVAGASDPRRPDGVPVASLTPTVHLIHSPEPSTGSPCRVSTAAHSPPSLLHSPLRN
jgi:hypothetical protein